MNTMTRLQQRLAERAGRTGTRRMPRSDGDRASTVLAREHDDTRRLESPRLDRWSPPNLLDHPADQGGYRFRWVAEYVNGYPTPRNVQRRIREGYARVNVSELPADYVVDEDTGDGIARTGGLVLMKIPLEFVEQRNAHYRRLRQSRSFGADALQGVRRDHQVVEDRGSRTIDGVEAGRALQEMTRR